MLPHKNFLHAALAGQYDAPAARGYDPTRDVLLVEGCDDGTWTFVPPTRSSMLPTNRMTRAAVEFIATQCHQALVTAWEVEGGATWQLRAGDLILRQLLRRVE